MKNQNVIEVNDVYKKFKNYHDKSHNLKEKVLHRERNRYDESWVLKGISFEVKQGEAVGLIGRNGCGKSTTLKLLTKIIYPDRGNIEIKGRVSSLLELGAGFHPDLSGYENIYLNAAVFGLTRKEIDKRVDEIVRFSELQDYINNPIRTYSSGMYMKLAFSVAINVNADILLIDEILGVGDVSFQKKCFEKLMEIKDSGTTIVIVSHSTDQIERICDRSIWIEDGVIRKEGTPVDIHKEYLEAMEERRLLRKQMEKEQRENAAKQEQEKADSDKRNRRRKERQEIERRREERRQRRLEGDTGEDTSKTLEELQKQTASELQKQRELEEKAALERAKQQEVANSTVPDETPIEVKRVEFFKREANRLELVVKEKNFEIERLNSVVRQKELEVNRVISEKDAEIQRLENVVEEKEDEVERLNAVILEKEEELDRVNLLMMED
ncbi:MAG: ABC transporter ATP-binding protein [Lachnospiraceae bacterium]|nr:ABC transporter ATP-binding protein [Lachnospiraceae bacterium]